MRILLAIILPFLAFFTIGRPFAGFICLILQITLIGWLPAAIWAAYSVSQYHAEKRMAQMMEQLNPTDKADLKTVIQVSVETFNDTKEFIAMISGIVVITYIGLFIGKNSYFSFIGMIFDTIF